MNHHWLIEFIFPSRLHRLAYFLRLTASNILTAFLYANNWLMNPLFLVCFIILMVIYCLFFIVLPRSRDIGMKGWWLLLCFIPGANVVLGLILLFRAPKYHLGTSVGTVEPKSE